MTDAWEENITFTKLRLAKVGDQEPLANPHTVPLELPTPLLIELPPPSEVAKPSKKRRKPQNKAPRKRPVAKSAGKRVKRGAKRASMPLAPTVLVPFQTPDPSVVPEFPFPADGFYFVDPFSNAGVSHHLAAVYLGNLASEVAGTCAFRFRLLKGSALYMDVCTPSALVQHVREKSTGRTLTVEEVAPFLDALCAHYGVAPPAIDQSSATVARTKKIRAQLSKQATETMNGSTYSYSNFNAVHFYGHYVYDVAIAFVDKQNHPERLEKHASKFVYPQRPTHKKRPHDMWYSIEHNAIEWSVASNPRKVLRALYHHLAAKGVPGFTVGSGEHLSTKWADAVYGIAYHINAVEKSQSGERTSKLFPPIERNLGL